VSATRRHSVAASAEQPLQSVCSRLPAGRVVVGIAGACVRRCATVAGCTMPAPRPGRVRCHVRACVCVACVRSLTSRACSTSPEVVSACSVTPWASPLGQAETSPRGTTRVHGSVRTAVTGWHPWLFGPSRGETREIRIETPDLGRRTYVYVTLRAGGGTRSGPGRGVGGA
jgi:hypothetical protein